jgi:predicted nucleic acid-binding Zn ribbon protein
VKPVKKVFTPVGVSFKGGGFYKTDSGSSSKSSSTAATPAAPAAPAAPSTPSAD